MFDEGPATLGVDWLCNWNRPTSINSDYESPPHNNIWLVRLVFSAETVFSSYNNLVRTLFFSKFQPDPVRLAESWLKLTENIVLTELL